MKAPTVKILANAPDVSEVHDQNHRCPGTWVMVKKAEVKVYGQV
jgi:hypothetical protein